VRPAYRRFATRGLTVVPSRRRTTKNSCRSSHLTVSEVQTIRNGMARKLLSLKCADLDVVKIGRRSLNRYDWTDQEAIFDALPPETEG
jgi:hypothetical protein